MDDINFANLAGGVVTATAALIRVTLPTGSVVEFVGNFEIDGAGAVAGGTLTGMREFFNGQLVYEVTGASVPASTFYRWVQNGDTYSALNAVFAGADTITGSRFDDYLIGYNGDDILDGGLGIDIMDGGAGNDTYYIDNVGDRIIDSSGTDTVVFGFNFNIGTLGGIIERFVLGTGVQFGEGGSSNDTIEGNALANNLNGLAGNDILRGFAGDDFLRGGAGNDTLDGGVGFDTASYSDATAGVTVNLSLTTAQVTGHGTDTLISIEQLNGSSFADRLTGSDAAETFLGLEGNDIIVAAGGNDIITGGAGNDSLNGGAGFDAALYSGVRRQYVATSNTISSTSEGTDTLVSVEEARFVDGILSFDVDGIPAQVMRLYDATLDRQPDQGGFEVQVRALASGSTTLQSLANAFVNSAEFQNRYGSLSNQQFVEQLYRFCLDREGDAAGIAVQVNALNSGTSRAQLVINFSESPEHRGLTQPILNAGLWVPNDQALQIARLYDATFDRLPDVAGLASQLAALNSGTPLLTIAAGFAASAEFQARYGALSNQAFVEQLYRFCLNREGDPVGIAVQVNALNNGASRAQLLLNFSESAEHVSLTAPSWSGGIRYVGYVGAPVEDIDGKGEAISVSPLIEEAALHYDPATLGLTGKYEDVFVLPSNPDGEIVPAAMSDYWHGATLVPEALLQMVGDDQATFLLAADLFGDAATGFDGGRLDLAWA